MNSRNRPVWVYCRFLILVILPRQLTCAVPSAIRHEDACVLELAPFLNRMRNLCLSLQISQICVHQRYGFTAYFQRQFCTSGMSSPCETTYFLCSANLL